MANSDVILERLLELHPKIIDLSLDRVERLLAAVGNPERHVPPVVHVAGTNGKGSTIAFLRAMLEAAGYSCHVYTSPHLERFHERIVLAGETIAEDRLADYLARCEEANGGEPITFFEITTAAAFLAFSETPADILLLEVGLGGRLDATNVIGKPLAAVITPISADHHQYLGDTIAEIAGEKAAIIKPGCPAVVAPQVPEAMAVIDAQIEKVSAIPLRAGTEWQRDGAVFRWDARAYEFAASGLTGAHQYDNAALAVAAAHCLAGFEISPEAMAAGMQKVRWPARLQKLVEGVIPAMLPDDWELWLDGGHNAGAGAVLAAQARAWRDEDGLPLVLVCGMINSKAPEDFLRPLAEHAERLVAVPVEGEAASLSPEDVAAAAKAVGMKATTAASVPAALNALSADYAGPKRVLICGSLYLAGAVLRANREV